MVSDRAEGERTWFWTSLTPEGIVFGITTPWGGITSEPISEEDYRQWLISELLKYPRARIPAGIRKAFGE